MDRSCRVDIAHHALSDERLHRVQAAVGLENLRQLHLSPDEELQLVPEPSSWSVSKALCLLRRDHELTCFRPAATSNAPRRKRTLIDLHNLKRKGTPITMLTAHDYPSGRFAESASNTSLLPATSTTPSAQRGIDVCLVGDSLAMVACGYTSTASLTLDEMLYHCRSVARGCHTSFLVADLPFGTASTVAKGSEAAIRLVQEGNMDAVKIEGGLEVVDLVRHLTSIGIPVMAHVGLKPQHQAALGGYRVQGKTVSSALTVWQEAKALEQAGAFAVLIEAIPSRLGAFISQRLEIPTIGIGAGNGCDGQVLVQLDMLGVSSLARGPRFLKKFEEMEPKAVGAIDEYVREVRERSFPNEEKHGYPMEDSEWEGFLEAVKGQ